MLVVMLFTGYANSFNLLPKLQKNLSKIIKNKKVLLIFLSAIGGILPIPGRTIASAGLLDTVIGKNSKLRPKFGILNYLATHHYYLWSPLEKTVIIPMAVLNVSYLGLLGHTWPLIIISIGILVGYVLISMRDISFEEININYENNTRILNPLKFINWRSLFLVYAAIVAGNFAKSYSSDIIEWATSQSSNLVLISISSFIAAWLMGSSSKFAGIVSILCGIFGLEYFIYFFAIEYAGYLLSPMHKCNAISCSYFNTPIKDYLKVLLIWAGSVIIYGITTII